MGLFFRKSFKIGPFRLNLSKSSIGLSVGVKGARISTGPRGTYLNVGRGGLSYQQKLDGENKARATADVTDPRATSQLYDEQNNNRTVASDRTSKGFFHALRERIRNWRTTRRERAQLRMKMRREAKAEREAALKAEKILQAQTKEKTAAERVAAFMNESESVSAASAIKRATSAQSMNQKSEEEEIEEMVRNAEVVRRESQESSKVDEASRSEEKELHQQSEVEHATAGEHNQLFKRALEICVQKKRASTAVLQKEFEIGYETAVAILDRMTEQGLIGKANGDRPRPILNLAFETIALWNAQRAIYGTPASDNTSDDRDEFFEEALRICVEVKRASTSVLQRRLRIGYGRAAAILDMMEREGFIGQADGARPRPILSRAYETIADWDERTSHKLPQYPMSDSQTKSAHDILGISVNAPIDEINAAYHKMAKMYHPDKVASLAPEFQELAERRMKAINAAYRILINQAK
jgi:hypothetical protein